MTYAQQLKDYENAVIQKRFEECAVRPPRCSLPPPAPSLAGQVHPHPP